MKKFIELILAGSLLGMAAAPAADAGLFKRKPRITEKTPIVVRDAGPAHSTDATHTSRKQMVASAQSALKRGRASLRTARSNLEAVSRSEVRNRDLRVASRGRFEAARLAYQSNATPENRTKAETARTDYLNVRQQHLSALSMRNSARARVNQLYGFQNAALASVKVASTLSPAAARAKAPRFNRSAQFVRPRSAYQRVPTMRQNFGFLPPPPPQQSGSAPGIQGALPPPPPPLAGAVGRTPARPPVVYDRFIRQNAANYEAANARLSF